MADEEGQDKDALLEKVDAVLDCVQPVYKDENFDSLKQVRNTPCQYDTPIDLFDHLSRA